MQNCGLLVFFFLLFYLNTGEVEGHVIKPPSKNVQTKDQEPSNTTGAFS